MTINRDLEILDKVMGYIVSYYTWPEAANMVFGVRLISRSMGYDISVDYSPYNSIEEYRIIGDENRVLIKKNRRDIRL